jgi:hypothetical protein
MAVVPFPDRTPSPDPHPLVFVVAELYDELRELRRSIGLPPDPPVPPRLRLVEAPDE